MNKNTFIFVAIVVVISAILFFFLFSKQEIKNYPSSGTHIIAFGDSLVQGVGASDNSKNFISLLSKKIGQPIVNLGVSGNTTADGLARLEALDKYKPKVVLLLLGGNDYLKKIPQETTFNNLEKIIKDLQSRGAVVVLLGVRGGLLSDRFESSFEDLSSETGTAYVSNVLDGLLTKEQYMFDAIHPNDLGYQKIADRVYPVLKKVLE